MPLKYWNAFYRECASVDNFIPIPWEEKTIDAMLYGSWFPYLYPLRSKIRTGIRKGVIKNAAIYNFPLHANKDKGWQERYVKHPRKVIKKIDSQKIIIYI